MPAPALTPTDRRRPRTRFAVFGVFAVVATVVVSAGISGAATDPGLGTADSFAVLGSGTVTNTGPTVVNGDLGVHPGNAVTGFDRPGGPGIVNGAIHAGNATAEDAQAGARTAYNALASQPCDETLTGQDLGGLELTTGVYCFSSSAQLTGALTLDAEGDPDAAFIFRIGTALTTASNSSVVFTDDLASCNVFWQVGSAATLGTDTDFVGTLITLTEAITANTGTTVLGRLLALNAAVTLDSNVITTSSCDTTPVDDTPVDDTPVDDTPVDDTPVDDTPVDDTPVDDTPVDDTPVDEQDDEAAVGGPSGDGAPTGDSSGEAVGGGPAVPAVTGGPAVPELTSGGGPGVPGVTTPGGPFVPSVPGGPGVPDSPRPPLPYTGSNMMLGVFGLLAIVLGAALVLVADPKRVAAVRPASSSPGAPRV